MNNNTIYTNTIIVAVHNGVFHADDVLCVALLHLYYPDAKVEVVRTRNADDFKKCNFVLDVGAKDEIGDDQICFDHHQKDNGTIEGTVVKHCAATKLAQYLKVPEGLFDKALLGVAVDDNGQQELKGKYPNPFTFVHSLNVGWDENLFGEVQDKNFSVAVDMAITVLKSLIHSCELEEKAEAISMAAAEKAAGGIAILPQFVGGWQKIICQYNDEHKEDDKVKLVVFKSGSTYRVQVVPVAADSFDSLIKLPEAWGGLRGEDLTKASGIPEAIFCHPGRFIAGWQTEEETVAAAKAAIAEASK